MVAWNQRGELGVTANKKDEVCFGGDGNVLKIDRGNGCTTRYIY